MRVSSIGFVQPTAASVATTLACFSLLLMLAERFSIAAYRAQIVLSNDKSEAINQLQQRQQRHSWRLPPPEKGLLEWKGRGLQAEESYKNDEGAGKKLRLPVGLRLVSLVGGGRSNPSTLSLQRANSAEPMVIAENIQQEEVGEGEDEGQLGEEPSKRRGRRSGGVVEQPGAHQSSIAYVVSPYSGRLIEVGNQLELGEMSARPKMDSMKEYNFVDLLMNAADQMSRNSGNNQHGASEFVYQIEHKQNNNDKLEQQLADKQSSSFQLNEPNRVEECRTIRSTILLTREQFEQPTSAAANLAAVQQQLVLTDDVSNANVNSNNNRLLARSCKGLVQVNKCEGFCSSIVRPSIKSRVGFKKECFCCNEGSLKRVQLRLNECYSATDNRRISPEEDEQRSFMDIEVEEPTDCKCRPCNSLV